MQLRTESPKLNQYDLDHGAQSATKMKIKIQTNDAQKIYHKNLHQQIL